MKVCPSRGTPTVVILVSILWGVGLSSSAQSRHLFFDPGFLHDSTGVTLTVNPPTKSEVVLTADRPWENMWLPFYLTVREDQGRLRMWYDCRDKEGRSNLAYAESTNGVSWTKPNLGVIAYHGSMANNLVGISSLEGTVCRDPHGRADARYIYVGSISSEGGIYLFTSPDGLHWKRDEKPLLPFECDTQNVVFWDGIKGKYELYLRGWGPDGPRDNRRRVVHIEASDLSRPLDVKSLGLSNNGLSSKLHPWITTEMPSVLECDLSDPIGTDIYTNSIQPYPIDPSWYVGFPALFRHFPQSPHPIADGWTEVQFAGSADGTQWHRYNHEVYADPGLPGQYSGSMVYMGTGMVVHGEEIWQYGTRYRTSHGDAEGRLREEDGAVCRFVQRVDGFVSADFSNSGGRCRTAAVKVNGTTLMLNLDAGAVGELRVGLIDENGKSISGYSIADCHLLRLNSTQARVSWTAGSALNFLLGREIQLAFAASHAKLYSFYFTSPNEAVR